MPEPTEPRPGLLHERDLRRRAADLLRATHRTWESVLPSRREPWSQFDAYVSALLANADLLQELTDAAKRRRTPPGRSRPVPEPTEPRRWWKSWPTHNLLAHPVSELLWLAGFERLSNRLHDGTVPPHEEGTGRG